MRATRLEFFVFIIIVIAGSAVITTAASSSQQKPYPVVTEIKDGVKTVTNPNFPREGSFTAKLTEEISCGEERGPQAGTLNAPFQLKVDGKGNIFVSDVGDTNIKVYDPDGRFVRTIGRQGQGPGEFGGLIFMDLLTGDMIVILDGAQHRVSILTTEGKFLSSFPLEGFFRSCAADRQDRLFLGKWDAAKMPGVLSGEFQEVPYITTIFRTDISGKELVRLEDLLGESILMKVSGEGGGVSVAGRLNGEIVWAMDPAGRLYGGFNFDYIISVYGPDGRKEQAFSRHYEPLKNPHYQGKTGQKKALPAYEALVFDESGNVWVGLYASENKGGTRYDVFSPDGIFLKQVAVPQKIACFKGGKIYSIVRPEEGLPTVKRYRVEFVPAARQSKGGRT